MKKHVLLHLPKHRGFEKQVLLSAALLAGAARGAQAQAPVPTDSLQRQHLNEVVVTAGRAATARGKVPQQIQVISRQDLQQTPSQEFTDALKKNATVDVIQFPGLLAGVGIRGFRPQYDGLNQRALLLVDGRPAGTANLATLDLGGVERIEVLKGPASALYGSQAMGGVVNVITRHSRGEVRSSLFAEYGSYQTFKVGGAAGGNLTKQLDFDLSFGLFDRAQDYKLGHGGIFRRWLDGGHATRTYANDSTARTDGQRADGQRRAFTKLNYYSGALRLGYQLSEHWRVDVRGERFVARNVQVPNDLTYGSLGPSSKDIERQNVDVSATGDYDHHQLSVRGYASKETNDFTTLADYSNAPVVPYRSYQSQYLWKGVQVKDVIRLGGQRVTVGVDHNEATSNSQAFDNTGANQSPYSPNYELNTTGLYAQGQLSFLRDKLIVTPGVRYDFITYNGKQTDLLTAYTPGKKTNPFFIFSPSLGAQYELADGLRAHATIGRAYVTPAAYNVAGYSQTVVNAARRQANVTQGNPNLKNESSLTWDAGLRFERPAAGLSADVTYFATRVRDRVTSRTTRPVGETTADGYAVLSRTTYINANDSRIRGLEAEVGYDFGVLADSRYSLRVYGGGTKIFRAEDLLAGANNAETARAIYNVARFSANYGVAYDSNHGLRARLSGHYVGRRLDLDFTDFNYPQIEYPRYMTLDFSAGYTLAGKHTLSVLVNNLTDENYYEIRGYNLPGRNVAGRYTLTF